MRYRDRMPPTIRCHYCDIPLEPNAVGVYRRVTGWAKNRSSGGTHQLALPGPTTGYACGPCIDLRSTRGATQQAESLF
jgi:hypothetical protein